MKMRLPDSVLVVEDKSGGSLTIRDLLVRVGMNPKAVDSTFLVNKAKERLKENPNPPDIVLMDICLEKGEISIVGKAMELVDDLAKLSQISGVRLLNWLRGHYPKMPVITMSDYWKAHVLHEDPKDLPHPDLSQQALTHIGKNTLQKEHIIGPLLWCAQQVVIGIHLSPAFREKALEVVQNLNESQNHFYFRVCDKEEDLLTPPADTVQNIGFAAIAFFEVWNNRVWAVIEDVEFKSVEKVNERKTQEKTTAKGLKADRVFSPILPFSRSPLIRFQVNLSGYLEFMGERYLEPYLLRECALAAYSLFFEFERHPIDTGECIFDTSSYAPDLLKGVKEGRICKDCQVQKEEAKTYGGWNEGRNAAVQTILKMGKESLEKINKKRGGRK